MSVSGMLRALSGEPFTVQDTTFDNDQNTIFLEPLDAGTYNPFPEAGEHVMANVENKGGVNGARGPAFVQLDMRIGYRARLGSRRTLDVFGDIFNVTDRANFEPPSGDRRIRANFLRYDDLVEGTGFPRQLQVGARLGF